MVKKFQTSSSLPTNYLQTNPLNLTDYSFGTFHTGTNVDIQSAELYGGQVVDSALPPGVYINPDDPANEFDPLKDKLVRVQEVTLYGKATTIPANGKSITAYTTETLQVRDAPLLSHAVFYNMDLEMHSGSAMNIGGTVHSNTNIWAMAKPGKPLNLNGTVTAGGKILHGRKANGKHDYTGDVNILDGSGNLTSMYEGGPTSIDESWLDNRDGEWAELANQTWDGNVQDGDHGAPILNPLEVLPYVPDDPNTDKTINGGNELENYAYSIIEPVLSTNDANYKGENVRAQKFAFKAGLTFEVTKNEPGDPGGNGQSNNDPSVDPSSSGVSVDPSSGGGSYSMGAGGGGKKSKKTSSSSSATASGGGYSIAAYRYKHVDNEDPTSDLVFDNNGDPIKIYFDSIPANVIGGAIVTGQQFSGIDPTKDANVKGGTHVDTYATDSQNEVIGGMFDKRVDSEGDGKLDVISLNLGSGGLKDAIENNVMWDSADDSSKPSNWWNGVVYVEFPIVPLDAEAKNRTGNDKLVVGAHPTLVLQTINSREIPDPKKSSSQSGQFIDERGMSLATNHPLYIVGSFNADGYAHTNDSTEPDDVTASDEPPALLAGDTMTILSANYGINREESNENMKWNSSTNHPSSGAHPARSHNNMRYIEISAALITGLAPTYPDGTPNADGTSSGGLHNFPRMIENWGGGTMTIRGSLISLFESEVHSQPRPTNYTSYYRWPTRDFGYNQNFAEGRYPPGAPVVRTFRRTAFNDLTKDEYDTNIVNLF